MAARKQQIDGRVTCYNFSPKGGLEGLIVSVGDQSVQVVCSPELGTALANIVKSGDQVTLTVAPAIPSDQGPATHPVFDLLELPAGAVTSTVTEGTVSRLNYAKHGEPNGVVLDTGDFVHLKPDGMRQSGLKVGDPIRAEGARRAMELGGWVVEAETVNGIEIRKKRKPH